MLSTIIFAGGFSVGEKMQDSQLKTVLAAKEHGAHLAILVNDIDVKRKIQFYEIGGEKMLIRHFGTRKKCGTTSPICELPDFEQVPQIIDWNFFEEALVRMRGADESEKLLREEVVPAAVEKRMKEYGLSPSLVHIFYERHLRNIASERLSETRRAQSGSWRALVEKAGILDELRAHISHIPVCGAIMLALFERVTKMGFSKLIDYSIEEERAVNQNALRLLSKLQEAAPEDPRWKLQIECKYFN